MDHEFWHERWELNQIGFHRDEINPYLQQHWPKLALKPGSRVLAPMCGKSNDMLWLLDQGYQVVGVELSPLAVAAFFSENGLQADKRQQGGFSIYEINELQIFCGDFFALDSSILGRIDAVYDRAALVALPYQMRLDYVSRMSALLEPCAQTLLVTFDYPQHEMSGPPFSVQHAEVEKLYQSWCDIELLADMDILDSELHFKNRGLSSLREQVYRLVVKDCRED